MWRHSLPIESMIPLYVAVTPEIPREPLFPDMPKRIATNNRDAASASILKAICQEIGSGNDSQCTEWANQTLKEIPSNGEIVQTCNQASSELREKAQCLINNRIYLPRN
jgi:hypothetical protein